MKSSDMKSIAVIGGTGFIGKAFVKYLLQKGNVQSKRTGTNSMHLT